MKIEVIFDNEGYVYSYGTINIMIDEQGNQYQVSHLDNSKLYIIDEQDYEAFGYMYEAYHDVDGKLVYDKNKSTEVYEDNVIEPMPTTQDLMAQIEALNKRINELTNDANNV